MIQKKRVLRSNKAIRDGVAILFEAMGVDYKPYAVVTPGSKDPFPGWFGTSRKPFSDTPKVCTKAEADSDLAEMRAQLPKPPVKTCQPPETTDVLDFSRATFIPATKHIRIILRIPVSGNRITKKTPTPKKPKITSVPAEGFKMPAILNGPKPIKPLSTPSPEKAKVKESQPPARRSPRTRKPRKIFE